jgi:hypothetical protein
LNDWLTIVPTSERTMTTNARFSGREELDQAIGPIKEAIEYPL